MPRRHDPEDLLDITRMADGSVVTVRSAGPGDEDALSALYASLGTEDRRRRFFTPYQPSRRQLEDWVRAERQGVGRRLVARLDSGEIIGDAGYFLLEDGSGDAEFDLTVVDEHRGWLGPYLFELLVEVAAAKGVPNLHADMLYENRQMLAIVRRRGYVTIPSDDFSIIHVVIGAASPQPTWPPDHTQPRVLVEGRNANWRGARDAHAHGAQVRVCPGPQSDHSWRCPVLDGKPCPLVEEADAVVFALPLDDPEAAAVLEAHPRLHPGAVLCVEPRWSEQAAHDLELPDGAVAVDVDDPDEAGTIVESIRRRRDAQDAGGR